MATDIPESMDELLYFTNRKLPSGMRIIAWVERMECPECGKDTMGKPINEKTGKVKTRSKTYECPACGYEEEKKEHEDKLTLQVRYTDDTGKNWKSTTTPYKRRTWQGMKAYVFINEFTGEKQGITKRLKLKSEKKK